MSEYDIEKGSNIDQYVDTADLDEREIITAELVQYSPPRRRFWLPLGLFIATCLSTFLVGSFRGGLINGLWYAVPVMTVLICHEAGHFFQARRYGVHASFPYFIPLPFTPLGTLGAVIGMEAHMGDRKALFDIGISGPLAGLVPTVIFCIVGLHWSEAIPKLPSNTLAYGSPLILEALSQWIVQPTADKPDILIHPMAFAGWVGLLITSLNLIPIGQLDGGHVLYAMLRTKAHRVAIALLLFAMVAVAFFGMTHWMLMVLLLIVMGPKHPPTADDDAPLGRGRVILGWLTLAFVIVGFTPVPIFLS